MDIVHTMWQSCADPGWKMYLPPTFLKARAIFMAIILDVLTIIQVCLLPIRCNHSINEFLLQRPSEEIRVSMRTPHLAMQRTWKQKVATTKAH